ncbi:hypothetical protein BGZ49_005471, partial [Haplosporangium sp. Z 27]
TNPAPPLSTLDCFDTLTKRNKPHKRSWTTMGILSHLSSSSKHTPKEWIAQANTELENSRKENNSKKALDLIQNAKLKIQKAEKSFSSARVKDPTLDDSIPSDIANAYHELGELLDKLGRSEMAQESRSKAQKWGYIHVVSGHTLSPQTDDSGSSNQSASHHGSLSAITSSVAINHQISDSNLIHSSTGNLTQEMTTTKTERTMVAPTGNTDHVPSGIFEKDVAPPIIKYILPEIDGRITSIPQL